MPQKRASNNVNSLLPLPPIASYILLLLLEGNRHGYSILLALSRKMAGFSVVSTATLYRTINRMLKEGLIEEANERPDPALDDRRRVYYGITDLGRAVAQAEVQRMAEFIEEVHKLGLIGPVEAEL